MTSLLFHVGADGTDKTTLGVSSPQFDHEEEEVRFKFIHIPDTRGTLDTRTFRFLDCHRFIPWEYENHIPHFDPDLIGFTYGEPLSHNKAQLLADLNPGDYLFFAASLAPTPLEGYKDPSKSIIERAQKRKMAKYLIGFFQVYDWFDVFRHGRNELQISPGKSIPEEVRNRLVDNAHFKNTDSHDFRCVVGVKDRNTLLLKRAVRLTFPGSPFRPTRFGVEFRGPANFPRGSKRLTEEQAKIGLARIATLVEPDLHLRLNH